MRILFVLLTLLTTSLVAAQQNGSESTNSATPYSFFGLGELRPQGTIANRSMGGMSTYNDSIRVNLVNPAAYADLRLTNFAVGATHRELKFTEDGGGEAKTSTTNVEYLAIGVPLGEGMGFGFGLKPFTSVGYNITDLNDPTRVSEYSGSGGINIVYAGFGIRLFDGFSVGVNADYNFGNIENKTRVIQDQVQFGTREFNRSDISGFSFTLAANYQRVIREDGLKLFSSFVYVPQNTLDSENFRTRGTFGFGLLGNEVPVDERTIDVPDSKLTIPSRVTFGLGIGEERKWYVGAEYTHEATSNFESRTTIIANQNFVDSGRWRAGGFYIPRYNDITNYFNRVVYRGGLRFENQGIEINGEEISEYGISLGLGLPVGKSRSFSNINVGFEYGQRGTTDSGLIREDFFSISLGLSFTDKWFQKTLFN